MDYEVMWNSLKETLQLTAIGTLLGDEYAKVASEVLHYMGILETKGYGGIIND